MDAYRAQQQGYDHPLQLIMSRKVRKEAKPHGENPPSGKDEEQYEQHVFIFPFLREEIPTWFFLFPQFFWT